MQFKTIAMFVGSAIAIAAPAAIAAPSQRACGNHEVAPAAVEQALGLKVASLRSQRQKTSSTSDSAKASSDVAFTSARIPVYWHVITDGTDGKLTSSQISASISALNSGYSGTGYSFYLAGSETTTNSNWFNNVNQGTSAEASMKNTLRKGGANALNVYTVKFTGGLLGYATFPWNYAGAPRNDGVVLNWTSYPGGPITNYNQGKTLVHEVGHWAGLYHVFQGGCSGQGDYVDDTPPQSTATNGCPSYQDSCPGGGPDSPSNFMDYSYDRCMTNFTSVSDQRTDLYGAKMVLYDETRRLTLILWRPVKKLARLLFRHSNRVKLLAWAPHTTLTVLKVYTSKRSFSADRLAGSPVSRCHARFFQTFAFTSGPQYRPHISLFSHLCSRHVMQWKWNSSTYMYLVLVSCLTMATKRHVGQTQNVVRLLLLSMRVIAVFKSAHLEGQTMVREDIVGQSCSSTLAKACSRWRQC